MQNTKVIQLLCTFSQGELNDFGKFLNSPYHNESQKMLKFYNYLRKFYPNFTSPLLSNESVFGVMYGDIKYDNKKLRERFSDMLKLAEEFIAFSNLKKNKIELKRLELHEFAERGLEKHFDQKHKEIKAILDNSEIIDSDYFLNIYYNERDRSDFYENRKLLGKRNTQYEEFAFEMDQFLNYFVSQMMYYFILMYNWQANLKYKFDYKFLLPVMDYIRENNLDRYPVIRAFYLIMKIRDNEGDDSLFYELKDVYYGNIEHFEVDDKLRIGTILFNDSQRRALQEKKGFESERYEILNFQLKHKLYPHENGWLSREQYINYVLVPLEMGKIEWAENFIENYTDRLAPERREDAYLYVNGYLLFTKKNYTAALNELSRIKGGDYIYYIRIKALQCMIYFELKEYEKVLTIIDSFKHYLTSNAVIPEVLIVRYTNFTNILGKLIFLYLEPDKFNAVKLKNEINGFSINDLTTNKHWLLKKAAELSVT